MGLKVYRPTSPGRRAMVSATFEDHQEEAGEVAACHT